MALWKEIWFRAGGTSLRTKSGLTLLLCCLTSLLVPTNASTDLLHNSPQFACSIPGYLTEETCVNANGNWNPVSKWGVGGWGIADQQYGKISCATCHVKGNGSGNIKRLRPVITAASSSFPGSTVTAQVAIPGSSSDYGDDDGSHTSSQRVCEVCHSKTYYHRFDTTAQVAEGGNLTHFNGSDCVSCHKHRQGFRAGCSDCHGNSDTGSAWPDGIDNNINTLYSAADDDAGSHERHVTAAGTGNASCAACHPLPAPTPVPATHINRTVDLTETVFSYASGTKTCSNISCHSGSDARWGSSACLGCHLTAQGARAAITGQFSANSHHIQGVTVSNSHCYQCHWEANIDGTINDAYHGRNSTAAVDLVVYGAGTRPLTYLAETTAIQYTANGDREEIAKLNQHCLGCHSDSNNLAVPFGDDKTPKQYAWDGTSIGNRYSQTGTTPWGKYTGTNITPKALRAKAYSAHGNAFANQGGWDLNETWPNTRAGTVNIACFDCHNSHGSSVAGKTVSYAESGGGILKDVTASKGGYSVSYRPLAGGSAETSNERNAGASLCFDCHLTANGGATTPWGYLGTFGASQQITGYFDTPYLAPGNAGPQLRYPYRQATSYKGGHFGASSPLETTPMGAIDGLCTPCHDPHGVSTTLGANQAYGVPLLKGTWLTSPYKEDVAPSNPLASFSYNTNTYRIDQNTFGANIFALVTGITETEQQFAGLCLQCHPKGSLTDGVTHIWKSKDRVHESVRGWKTTGGPVKHSYTCSKCHSPHMGSSLPRLMVTNCLDAFQKGRGTAGTRIVINGVDDWNVTTGHIPKGSSAVRCHEVALGNAYFGMDQSWNALTPWNNDSAPAITVGPIANPYHFIYDSSWYFEANVNWSTDVISTATVEWGTTTAYGNSYGRGLGTQHSIPIWPLANNTTYHYRVRSKNNLGQEVVSGDQTFTVSVPPTVPTLIAEPDAVCTADCPVTLAWYASSYPGGGTIEYEVQLDDAANFSSPLPSAGWTTLASYTPTLTTGTTWYWRVRSREAAHPAVLSGWSGSDAFRIMSASPPPAPMLIAEPDYDSGCANTLVTVAWNPTASPDGDPVEYFVDAGYTNSGWLPASQTSWSFTVTAGAGVTWKVHTRDSLHPDATSTSASDYFYDIGSLCWWGSCPLVFGWNGTNYDYVTDLQGPIIGLPPSNIQKDTGLYQPTVAVLENLAPKEGHYHLKLRESLPEITFLDSTRLLVVDHPEGYEIHTSGAENTYNYGYADPLTVYTAKDPLLPQAAYDSQGNDVLASVLKVDNLPAPMDPIATDNFYTFDFGHLSRSESAKLLIDGWSVYGVKKFKSDITIQPYIEVVNQNGSWVKVKSIGTPAGDLKTMVVDLSNLFLSDDHRIRLHLGIRRGSRWLIDRIRLDQSEPVPFSVREVQAVSADLQFGGTAIHAMSTLESRIIAEDVILPVSSVMPSYGNFTRYGDVTELMSGSDDKFVIMREGDKVDLRFPAVEPPRAGLSRTFILLADLYYKTLTTSSVVEPLPFHGMSDYPYPESESYPMDAEHMQYLQQYNTRRYDPPLP